MPPNNRLYQELGSYTSTGELLVRDRVSGDGVAAAFTTGDPNGTQGSKGQIVIDQTTNETWQNTAGGVVWTRYGLGGGFFGTGRMGALVFDGAATVVIPGFASIVPAGGVYLLPFDLFAETVVVSSGVVVDTGGYRVFVKGQLSLDGIISRSGFAGGNGSAVAAGAGGAALAAGTLPGGVVGGLGGLGGGVGSTGGGRSNVPRPAQSGAAPLEGSGGLCQGGGGGHGNVAGVSGDGPAGGGISLVANNLGLPDELGSAIRAVTTNAAAISSGGSGSGGTGGQVAGGPGSTGGGGGGGSVGGYVVVLARTVVGAGSVSAAGGPGGNGGVGTGVGLGGGGGGGGGAAGGIVVLATTSRSWANTNVIGGARGASSGVGSATQGGLGGNGLLYRFDL